MNRKVLLIAAAGAVALVAAWFVLVDWQREEDRCTDSTARGSSSVDSTTDTTSSG